MTKEELIKKLEELRDVNNYSHYELTNKGYREGLLDALDLVNKYFDLALVSGRSEQLKALLEKLLENNMCSHDGDELIEEALKGF
jgi:hypothetical protein